MQEYNGYSSWNSWNVNLWINNTQYLWCLGLHLSEDVIRGRATLEEAIDGLIDLTHQFFKDGKTPDGAVVDRDSCKEWLLNNHFED